MCYIKLIHLNLLKGFRVLFWAPLPWGSGQAVVPSHLGFHLEELLYEHCTQPLIHCLSSPEYVTMEATLVSTYYVQSLRISTPLQSNYQSTVRKLKLKV